MTSRPEREIPSVEGELERFGEGPEDDATDEPTGLDSEPEPVGQAVDQILTDVVALTAERDEYLGALQRSQADFANYRKRVMRQQEEQGARAALDLVAKILPVLDTLDLAVVHLGGGHDGSDGESSSEGGALRQARAQLLDTLAKEGLERVDEAQVPFDPEVHDAVAHAPASEDDDNGPGGATIEEVLRAGYRWRGHTLRPAMVRVRG